MAQGQSLEMKDAEEKIMEGVLQFYYDIKGEKATNTDLSKWNSDLTSRGPMEVICRNYLSYLKVHVVN